MTAQGDRSARTAPAPFRFDPATKYPEQYSAGQAAANRLIEKRPSTVGTVLAMANEHLENWPAGQTKLPDTAWAMEKGFADTLNEYRQEQGS